MDAMDDLAQQTRAGAFRLLLETGRAVSAQQIAAELNVKPSAVEGELRRLDAAGRIHRDTGGHVVGSAGLIGAGRARAVARLTPILVLVRVRHGRYHWRPAGGCPKLVP